MLPQIVVDQIVVDQIDAQLVGVASADVPAERQHVARCVGQPIAAEQDVGVEIACGEEVAPAAPAHTRGALPPGPLATRVAMTRVGLERTRTELIEARHHTVSRRVR